MFADGHNYTRRSLRDRILMGMFAVNIMYSVGLVIPVNLVHTSNDARCGTTVIPFGITTAVSFGLFVGGKYAMVLYEMFIVGASLLSLKTGRTELPRRVEIMAHTTCVAVGVGMFVGWTVCWAALVTDMVSDLKGGTPADIKAAVHDNAEFNASLNAMLRAWVAVLAVVIVLWGWSRLVLRQLEREWDEALIDANQQWDRDREDSHMRAPVGSALPPPPSCMLNRVLPASSLPSVARMAIGAQSFHMFDPPPSFLLHVFPSQSGTSAIRRLKGSGCRSAVCST